MESTPSEVDNVGSVLDSILALPEAKRPQAAYEFVRDIAYGDIGSRNPMDVLMKMKGTCSGKHALLKTLLESLGFEVQSWFAKHDFGKSPINPWPEELAAFQGKRIDDYHDFLKVKVGGRWLTIDAVYDKSLKEFGFPMLEWDGQSDMKLPVETSEVFQAEGDMEEHKKKLIAALSEETQRERKEFLSALTAWLDAKRR